MNEEKRSNLYQITKIMNNDDGFCQISTNYRHWIKMDILSRFELAELYWNTLGDFVANYVCWVNEYLSAKAMDPAAMWEQWAEMLKELHLGK
jgi:hypothetical protein